MKTVKIEGKARDLLFMANPCLWPHGAFLCLTRRTPGAAEPELGILADFWGRCGVPGYSSTVFKVNIFDLAVMDAPTRTLLSGLVPREMFDTLEEMYEAGWRVD